MVDPRALLATTALLAAAVQARAQTPALDPNAWRAVVYADLQLPNPDGIAYALLWADEIKRNNEAYTARGDSRWSVANAPASESHIVVRSPVKTVVLSVLHTLTACSPIRRDPAAKATLKRCPMRLAIYRKGRLALADAGNGCFIEYERQAGEPPADLARNAAMGAYEVKSRTIRAGVVFQGAIARECQFRVPVPQP